MIFIVFSLLFGKVFAQNLFQDSGNIITKLNPPAQTNLLNLNNMSEGSMLFNPPLLCNKSFVFTEPEKKDDGRVLLFEVKYQANPFKGEETFKQNPYFSPYKDQFLDLKNSTTEAELNTKMQNIANSMSDDEYKNFLGDLADYLPYNGDRAGFKQKTGAGLGVFTPFELITMQDSKQGICGDHAMVISHFAELKGWEAITIGYNVDRSQHVISGIIDPKDPSHITLINYNSVQENTIGGSTEMNLSENRSGYEDISTMYRIFKGKDAKQVQIGNLDNSLRGFLLSLSKKEYELNKAYMGNQNFNQVKLGTESTTNSVTQRKNGGILETQMTKGISIYQGSTNDQDIFGIYVSKDVYKQLKDEQGKVKTQKYFSTSMANSFLNYKDFDSDLNMLNVYINIHGGVIHSLYESEYFKFGGILGYQVDGYGSFGAVLAGDGNFESFAQAYGEFSKNNTNIKLTAKLDETIAIRNQLAMTDLKKDVTGNLNPFMTNAVGADLNISQKLNPSTTFVSNNSAMVSRIGNRIVMSTGILKNNTSVMVGYQGGMGKMRLTDNSVHSINMYQNSTGVDGFNLSLSQNFQYKSLNGTASAWVKGITTNQAPFVGGTVKLNLNAKPKRKPAL